MSQQIYNALATRLSGSSSLMAAVGERIYELEAPLNAKLPLIRFAAVTNPITRSFGDRRGQSMLVQIDIYEDKENGTDTLGSIEEIMYQHLEQAEVEVAGHDRGTIMCERRDIRSIEDDAIRSLSEYRIIGYSNGD